MNISLRKGFCETPMKRGLCKALILRVSLYETPRGGFMKPIERGGLQSPPGFTKPLGFTNLLYTGGFAKLLGTS